MNALEATVVPLVGSSDSTTVRDRRTRVSADFHNSDDIRSSFSLLRGKRISNEIGEGDRRTRDESKVATRRKR